GAMSKRDQVKKRLEQIRKSLDRARQSPDEMKKWRRQFLGRPDWKPMERAAAYFGLDPSDESDRTVLLRALTYVLFPKSKKGRPKGSDYWNPKRLFKLGSLLYELERKSGPLSDSDAARKLIKKHPEYGIGDQWVSLRQRLPEARGVFLLYNQNDYESRLQSMPVEMAANYWLAMHRTVLKRCRETPEGREYLKREAGKINQAIETMKGLQAERAKIEKAKKRKHKEPSIVPAQ